MNTKTDKLSDELRANLAAIRLAVGKLSGARRPWDPDSPIDLIDQGDRMVHCYEKWLLDDEQKQMFSLQPQVMFILYASSYLCDIGLTNDEGLSPRTKGFKDDRTPAVFNQSLATRSCRLIRDGWQDMGIPDRAFVDIITRVCRHSSAADTGVFTAAESEGPVIDGAVVKIPLLAACLQLGKAFDLNSPTTVLQIFSHMPADSRISPNRLEANFSVADAGAHSYLNGTIHLKIRCSHPEVHKALKHHERTVQLLLEQLNQRVRPRFLYSDVIYEIEPDGYTPIDLKFTVDSSAGLQLFMGNRLYTDKRVFLRELIQNAVDACNYRKLVDNHYSPMIVIEFNDDVSTIKVRDNGIGMTRQWIEKYFLAIGISFYQSNEIRDHNRNPRINFGFISQFGIGFLSSFQVADKIIIKTRKASFPGLMVTISSLRDYFDVSVLEEDYPVGTEVTLHLKKSKINYCRSVEYTGYLKTNIRFLGQDKCELSIDRNRMFWKTDQLQNIKRVILHGLVDVANQLMSAVQAQDVSVNTLNSIVNHLAIFFDFNDVDDGMYNHLSEPIRRIVEKRFRDFVRINFAHTAKKNGIAEADDYSESWQQQVLKSLQPFTGS